jgi:hypothetical protein
MLFDLSDYEVFGIIGLNQLPVSEIAWSDAENIAMETLEAIDNSVGQYLETSNFAVSPCSEKLNELLQQRIDSYNELNLNFETFWTAMIAGDATLVEYDLYQESVKNYVKAIREIIAFIDGDRFKIVK